MTVSTMTAQDILAELKEHNVIMHHKTGIDKLRETLTAVRAGTYIEADTSTDIPEIEDTPEAITAAKKANKVTTKKVVLTKEQRALKLVRIVVTPNDPLMSTHNGMIFTVGSSAVNNGRMIKKYVPFNNDEGWHVPTIIYDQIRNAEMQKFKTVKMPNGEKAPQAYIAKKFNVEVLEPLTKDEMKALAAAQSARGDA